MTAAVPQQLRKRKSTARSQSGCLVCRQRHLKCDEVKPACKRCQAAGWRCKYGERGCDRKWKWSSQNPSLPTPRQKLLVIPDGDPDLPYAERKALVYFSQVASGQLFGYLISDLWTHLIPQRCHVSPTVRASIVALSLIHQDMIASSDRISPAEDRPNARSQENNLRYGNALVQLQTYIEREAVPSKLEVLLACAALICCMLLQRKPEEATQHLDRGLEIVRAWKQEIKSRKSNCRSHLENADFKTITNAFFAMDVYATAYNDTRLPSAVSVDRGSDIYCEPPNFDHFQTLKDAQEVLIQILTAAFKDLIECAPYKFNATPEVPQRLINQRTSNRISFKKWLVAFKSLEMEYGTHPTVDLNETRRIRNAIAIMRTQCLAMEALLNETICDNTEACAFAFDTNASQLLQWAELAIGQRQPAHPEKPAFKFSLDIGVAPQLVLLAVKTSQPSVRSRALFLLSRIQRLEGWYDPSAMAKSILYVSSCQTEEQLEKPFRPLDSCEASMTRTTLEWPVAQVIAENFGNDAAGIGRLQELCSVSG